MFPAARWLLVLAVAVGLVAAPAIARAWPVAQSDLDAAALADAVRASATTGWSGEVRSQGSVEIPESDSQLDGVARLLGESSTLRVWWRSPEEHRVDRVRSSGETDTVRAGGFTVRWRYEGNQVTVFRDRGGSLRLPDDPDVVPVALARRLLAGVDDDALSRIPDERVAGRAAAGLRITPDDDLSSIARVDLWADQASGIPLRVEVWGVGDDSPSLASEVTDLDLRRPTQREVFLELRRDADFSRGRSLDDDPVPGLPDSLVGLERRDQPQVYGRGPTTLAVIPVRDSVARGLRQQLRRVAATTDTGARQSVAFGPVSVVLTRVDDEAVLLVGTVRLDGLDRAADQAGGAR